MALKYGDAVVLVQRLPDGTLRRVNAIVMHSAVQPPNVHRSKALKDHRGIIPEGEYLDIAFPRVLAYGQALKSRTMEALFQPDWAVPAWKEGANKGWELPATFEAENAELKAQLVAEQALNDKIVATYQARVAELEGHPASTIEGISDATS